MHMHTTLRSFVESADIRQKGKSNHALEFLIIPPAPAQASKEVGFEIFLSAAATKRMDPDHEIHQQ